MFLDRVLLPVLVGFAIAGGLFGEVKSFPSNNVDFTQYKTYQWLPPRVLTKSGIVENEPTVSPIIEAAFKQELAKIGLTEVSQGADVQIATGALTESVPQLEAVFFGPIDFGPGTTWGGTPTATMGRYNKQGSLILNMIDVRTNKSAWVAIATKALGKPSQNEKAIHKATSEIFKKYPKKR
jgi:hypothetical protein